MAILVVCSLLAPLIAFIVCQEATSALTRSSRREGADHTFLQSATDLAQTCRELAQQTRALSWAIFLPQLIQACLFAVPENQPLVLFGVIGIPTVVWVTLFAAAQLALCVALTWTLNCVAALANLQAQKDEISTRSDSGLHDATNLLQTASITMTAYLVLYIPLLLLVRALSNFHPNWR